MCCCINTDFYFDHLRQQEFVVFLLLDGQNYLFLQELKEFKMYIRNIDRILIPEKDTLIPMTFLDKNPNIVLYFLLKNAVNKTIVTILFSVTVKCVNIVRSVVHMFNVQYKCKSKL